MDICPAAVSVPQCDREWSLLGSLVHVLCGTAETPKGTAANDPTSWCQGG
jgi:hypothetical protein